MATFSRTDFLPPEISAADVDSTLSRLVLPITLPGSPFAPQITGGGWTASGDDFQLQFKLAGGAGADYEGEICGMRSYRSQTWGASYDGKSWSGEILYEYVFEHGDSPNIKRLISKAYVGDTDKPTSPVTARGQDPDRFDYVVIEEDADHNESIHVVGSLTFADEVTRTWLKGEAERYAREDSSWRLQIGGEISSTSTDTDGGWFAKYGLGFAKASLDISEDIQFGGTYLGYQGTPMVNFLMEDRLNAPCLYDEGEWLASGLSLYPNGREEWTLEELIEENFWLDDHGTYDPTPTALQQIGWEPGQDGNFVSAIRFGGNSTVAKGFFLSVNADNYRVTLQAGKNSVEGEWIPVQTVVVETPSGGGMVEWTFSKAAIEAGEADWWMITKLEHLASGGWETIAEGFDTATYIRSSPYEEGAQVVVGTRFRTGSRWGYPRFNADSYEDSGSYYRRKRLLVARECASVAATT